MVWPFSGGMPVLKATGRGRLGPANQPSSGPGGLSRTPSTETVPTASTSWKPKTLNGSTSGSSISSPSSVNRGPPPQPPPASRKPSLVAVTMSCIILSSIVSDKFLFSFLANRVTQRIIHPSAGIRQLSLQNRRHWILANPIWRPNRPLPNRNLPVLFHRLPDEVELLRLSGRLLRLNRPALRVWAWIGRSIQPAHLHHRHPVPNRRSSGRRVFVRLNLEFQEIQILKNPSLIAKKGGIKVHRTFPRLQLRLLRHPTDTRRYHVMQFRRRESPEPLVDHCHPFHAFRWPTVFIPVRLKYGHLQYVRHRPHSGSILLLRFHLHLLLVPLHHLHRIGWVLLLHRLLLCPIADPLVSITTTADLRLRQLEDPPCSGVADRWRHCLPWSSLHRRRHRPVWPTPSSSQPKRKISSHDLQVASARWTICRRRNLLLASRKIIQLVNVGLKFLLFFFSS